MPPPMNAMMPAGRSQVPLRTAVRCRPACKKIGNTKNAPNSPIANTVVLINPYRKPRCTRSVKSNTTGLPVSDAVELDADEDA